MSGRHGGRGSGTLDAHTDTRAPREPGSADYPPTLMALATINGSGERRCLCCQGDRMHRHGKGRTGMQRWRCRDCSRTFSSTTDTMLAGLHAPGKLGIVVSDMLSTEPSSCRRLASALQLSKMTIWAWRQKVSRAFAAIQPVTDNDGEHLGANNAAQLAETVLRESRKASREWVDHQRDPARCPTPDRLRWVDYRMHDLPLPQPMAPYLVTVSFAPNGPSRHECGRMLAEAYALATTKQGNVLPSTCARAGGAEARSTDPRSARRPACKSGENGALATGPLPMPLNSSDLVDRFQTFVRAFSGPATKYLAGYLAWFDARLRAPDDRCTRQVWRATLKVLATRLPTRFCDMVSVARHGPQQRSTAA